ncbi:MULTISPECIES: hypothetical protein [Bacteroidaceae]|uniref:hypothetical protein n=1 Tax=Bacteroidaceae TaxID=815 RepID=UPI00039EECEC|nr:MULTISPECIES: hypothetical protein [Bacteroidaceae]
MKPFGFSLPGDFYDAITRRNKGRKANVASGKKETEYPIWHKLRKAAVCFPCRQEQRHLLSAPPSVTLYREIEPGARMTE